VGQKIWRGGRRAIVHHLIGKIVKKMQEIRSYGGCIYTHTQELENKIQT
jgi:hypothetical protein